MESIELCLYPKRKNQSPNEICDDLTMASNYQKLPLVLNVMSPFFPIMYVSNVGLITARP
jgi:hypothetical protein